MLCTLHHVFVHLDSRRRPDCPPQALCKLAPRLHVVDVRVAALVQLLRRGTMLSPSRTSGSFPALGPAEESAMASME